MSQLLAQESRLLTSAQTDQLIEDVLDELLGLGPLEPLLKDDSVNDILINTHSTVLRRAQGPARGDRGSFPGHRASRSASSTRSSPPWAGASTNRQPMVDARLADGSRVNAIIPPLAVDGPLVSIRKFAAVPIHMARLVELRTITEEMAQGAEGDRPVPAQCPHFGRHRLGQDDAAERAVGLSSTTANASSRSRIPPNCSSSSRTSAGWKRGRPTSKARAKSPSATWCATRCACAPTASSSAKCAPARPSTCCRR